MLYILKEMALLPKKLHESVWVASADCTPVLMADRTLGKVCAIHSGWRGTASEIVPDAIALFDHLGSKKRRLTLCPRACYSWRSVSSGYSRGITGIINHF